MICYKVGDATQPCSDGIKLIVHCCNTLGAWGAGFTAALSKRWTEPETHYRVMLKSVLGTVQIVQVENEIYVANLIGQEGLAGQAALPPIRYSAFAAGFESLGGLGDGTQRLRAHAEDRLRAPQAETGHASNLFLMSTSSHETSR